MVDFRKLRGKGPTTKEIDPIMVFERLDKESGKEYLRPPQETILRSWHEKFRDKRDIIVKLHTGQGKTLISLLMLQSSLNEGLGPAICLCPNNYLVNQTVEQARSFGIRTVEFPDSPSRPPREFLNSEAILVANCKKMFNGKSVFGVTGSEREHIPIGTISIDDAHKCVDIIRESFSINVDKDSSTTSNSLYKELWSLFQEALNRQAPGTHQDILSGRDAVMGVPFWVWLEKQNEVLKILGKHKEDQELFFVWDLLKDHLHYSICIFSGTKLLITPRLLPIEMIQSFTRAKRRILLSATLTEDAFLLRDLGIEKESVTNPLTMSEIAYSGERMILIPSLVDPSITREQIVEWLSHFTSKHGSFGVISIVPSFKHATYWEKFGGATTNVQNLSNSITTLKEKIRQRSAKNILILVNEYDGVDLPDSTCRILCLDSMPSYSSLLDGYLQKIRPYSTSIRRQIAQRVEQGMGRGIRGINDWCIVVVTGTALTDFLSENAKRAFLSGEAQTQIKIAEELTELMKEDLVKDKVGLSVMEKLVNQCLNRDEGWKDYYREKMESTVHTGSTNDYVFRAIKEREAEILNQQGRHQEAANIMQELVDVSDPDDKGWYFQLMATYLYHVDPSKSMDKQVNAHLQNPRLFRPEAGIRYSKLEASSSSRDSLILDWIKKHQSPSSLIICLQNALDDVAFGNESDSFEDGIDFLGKVLGFRTQRPEKQTGYGPDNLWHVAGKSYWMISCKNMVLSGRTGISKSEAGQLNNEIGWFKEHYAGSLVTPIIIHPSNTLEKGAYLNEPSWAIRKDSLEKLKINTKNFYNSLCGVGFDSISSDIVKQKLASFHLDTDTLTKEYLERVSES